MKLFGVLVTFERPDELRATLGRLAAQSRMLDSLVVVDNSRSGSARDVLSAYPGRAVYIHAGDNLGPAGGFALGMEHVLVEAEDSDWIFVLDDDDPPFFDDAIEKAAEFAAAQIRRDPKTAGVGISGGRFDWKFGRVLRVGDAEIAGPVPVDHITGGGMPAYRVAAVRDVGTFCADLFFGFEELEYGTRLCRAGYSLYADGDEWRRRKVVKREMGLLPPEKVSASRSPSLRVAPLSWRRYYSLRNLTYLLRRRGGHPLALAVAFARGVLKPLVNMVLSPRESWPVLRLSWSAIRDGWTGRLGRRVEPDLRRVDVS